MRAQKKLKKIIENADLVEKCINILEKKNNKAMTDTLVRTFIVFLN